MPNAVCNHYLRRGRTALMACGLGFVALQAGLVLVQEAWPSVADPFYRAKLAALNRRYAPESGATLIAMFGSSRTFNNFDAARLEQSLTQATGHRTVVHNMGFTGAGPVPGFVYLRRMVRAGIAPDVAIFEVMPPFFNQGELPFITKLFPAERLAVQEVKFVERYLSAYPEPFHVWAGKIVPWFTQRAELMHAVSPKLLIDPWRFYAPFDEHGFSGIDPSRRSPEVFEIGMQFSRKSYANSLRHFRLGGVSCQALRDALAYCREHDIRAMLLLLPEGIEFRSWYVPETQAQLLEFLRDLQRDFGVAVIDASDWIDDERSLDGHHLLTDGAAELADRIAPRLAAVAQARGIERNRKLR
ncbi:MAG TPA: hypothetical protein VFI31_06025 [Pirellulales bacterium]|nr:hypothetical protein [Pirellulales bacterium]